MSTDVKAKMFQRPSCNGSGGEIDVVCEDGTGPREICGFCDGNGKLSRLQFFVALGYISWNKRISKESKQ